VAGTAALLVDIDSHMNGAQARNVFGQSSTPIGNQGLGAGELDAYQAVLNASRKNGKDN
jgi:hypothetical protein